MKEATSMDKSPRETFIILTNDLFYYWSLKKALFSMLLFPLPTQYNVEKHKKLQVVYNIVEGGGAKLGRWSCNCVWRVPKSAKNANFSQDFCPRLKLPVPALSTKQMKSLTKELRRNKQLKTSWPLTVDKRILIPRCIIYTRCILRSISSCC